MRGDEKRDINQRHRRRKERREAGTGYSPPAMARRTSSSVSGGGGGVRGVRGRRSSIVVYVRPSAQLRPGHKGALAAMARPPPPPPPTSNVTSPPPPSSSSSQPNLPVHSLPGMVTSVPLFCFLGGTPHPRVRRGKWIRKG